MHTMIITHDRVLRVLHTYILVLIYMGMKLCLVATILRPESLIFFIPGLISFVVIIFYAAHTKTILERLSVITRDESILYARGLMYTYRRSAALTAVLSLGTLFTGVPALIMLGIPAYALRFFYCKKLATQKLSTE